MSPLIYNTKSATPPNPCLECGEQCRRPKRFCCDSHKEAWLSRKIMEIDPRGVSQVARDRARLGITPESLEWRRKLSVSQPF